MNEGSLVPIASDGEGEHKGRCRCRYFEAVGISSGISAQLVSGTDEAGERNRDDN